VEERIADNVSASGKGEPPVVDGLESVVHGDAGKVEARDDP
jgi:hypothetical protein